MIFKLVLDDALTTVSRQEYSPVHWRVRDEFPSTVMEESRQELYPEHSMIQSEVHCIWEYRHSSSEEQSKIHISPDEQSKTTVGFVVGKMVGSTVGSMVGTVVGSYVGS